MAKSIDRDLFNRLHANGVRKRVARMLSEAAATGRSAGGRADASARKAITDLRSIADELEGRLKGGDSSRSEAAKKAAATRKRAATKRSTAAKKAAATRAKNSGTSSRSSGSRSSGTRSSNSRSRSTRSRAASKS